MKNKVGKRRDTKKVRRGGGEGKKIILSYKKNPPIPQWGLD
jgi:hypothetical protein